MERIESSLLSYALFLLLHNSVVMTQSFYTIFIIKLEFFNIWFMRRASVVAAFLIISLVLILVKSFICVCRFRSMFYTLYVIGWRYKHKYGESITIRYSPVNSFLWSSKRQTDLAYHYYQREFNHPWVHYTYDASLDYIALFTMKHKYRMVWSSSGESRSLHGRSSDTKFSKQLLKLYYFQRPNKSMRVYRSFGREEISVKW